MRTDDGKQGPRVSGGELVIPVVAEELHVERLVSDTERVLVKTRVEQENVVVDAPRIEEQVSVERVAIDRFVDGPIAVRQEGATTIVSVVEEVTVVTKRFVLREEVRLTKTRHEEKLQAAVTLQKQVVTVERLSPERETPVPIDEEAIQHG